jgi:hypothetical protein
MYRISIPLSFCLALLACGGDDSQQEEPIDVLAYSGWLPAGTYVFQSSLEMQGKLDSSLPTAPDALYVVSGRPLTPPPIPPINFSTKTVLAYSQGIGNRCQKLIITRATRSGAGLTLVYKLDPPAASLICYQAPNTPGNIFVAVSKFQGNVLFTSE